MTTGYHCADCGVGLDPAAPGVYRHVEGWTQNRKAGGANMILWPHEVGEYLCIPCGNDRRNFHGQRPAERQGSLFGG